MRAKLPVFISLVASFAIASAACGSSDPAAPENQIRSSTGGAAGAAGSGAGGSDAGGSAGTSAQGGGAQGIVYPKSGFGYAVGTVIEDLSFQGVPNPAALGFVSAPSAVKMSMHDFYNPKNDPAKAFDPAKPTALVVVIAALWCGPCGTETQTITGTASKPGYHDYWKDKGVMFMQTVYQNDAGEPAEFKDLDFWTKKYNVQFTSVIDPGAKFDAYFPTPGFPHALIVDLTTMKIAFADSGGDFGPNNSILKQITGN